ncbi:MAG TPA: class I SAM-dependent methyltransferase [Kiritimatiellia bacterium]|jgi:hypothetical protein
MLARAKDFLRGRFDTEQRVKMRKWQSLHWRGPQHALYRLLFGGNLKALAMVYGSDKWGAHWYAEEYERHFAPMRLQNLKILEIGIGGYDDAELGGASLRMWRTYFPNAQIYGLDICDKHLHDERRIKTFQGSQADEALLGRIVEETGPLDIIIDDGSHRNEHILASFKYLFPHVSENGWYVVEDVQTSYWTDYGGAVDVPARQNTAMGFLKSLADGLNHLEYRTHNYEPTYYDRNIVGLHFYRNLVFVRKGRHVDADGGGRSHPKEN